MVYRVYVEKKQGFLHEANSLLNDIKVFLGINSLQNLRVINRYDVENIDEQLFNYAKKIKIDLTLPIYGKLCFLKMPHGVKLSILRMHPLVCGIHCITEELLDLPCQNHLCNAIRGTRLLRVCLPMLSTFSQGHVYHRYSCF